ncbi:MAG: site-specific integrase [Blautia sp.]|nr:site-specific integrase [Blautia sp.]
MARMAAGVRKKDNGHYEKRFTVAGQRFSVSGSSSKECIEKEHRIRQMIADGSYIACRNITLSEYFTEWEEGRKAVVKKSTADRVHRQFITNIEPTLGKCRIQKIEKRQIIDLQRKLLTDHKPTTVNLIVTSLKTILNGAVDDEIITKNPAASVKAVRTDDQEKATETIHRALTREEQDIFMTAACDEWLYEFFYFSLCTGMRIMEINALEWRDIDYVNACIHVTKTLAKNYDTGDYRVTTPKTASSKRDIPLTDTIKKILARQKEKMFMVYGGKAVGQQSRIFISSYGRVVHSTSVSRTIKRLLDQIEREQGVKIEPFAHHAFRDTFATRFIENGGNMQTLKTILGHSSLSMTADLYSHVLPDTKAKEMEMIEGAFGEVADL